MLFDRSVINRTIRKINTMSERSRRSRSSSTVGGKASRINRRFLRRTRTYDAYVHSHQTFTHQYNTMNNTYRDDDTDEPRSYQNRRNSSRERSFRERGRGGIVDDRQRKRSDVLPYPEPTSMQRRETILFFQDLRRKRARHKDMNFVPDIPKEVIMGRRTYMEHEKRTRRISRRVKNRLKLQEPVTFTLERDKKGKLGVKMDRDLNITKVEKFAAKCGASIGQKIIQFNGIPVVTKTDVLNAMKKTAGSKAKQLTLTIVYDPLALTELRAEELARLSQAKVRVPLHEVPKIEMREYVQLNPSRPDRQRISKIQSAKRRIQRADFNPQRFKASC